jgi:hypothetical protein
MVNTAVAQATALEICAIRLHIGDYFSGICLRRLTALLAQSTKSIDGQQPFFSRR